MHRVVIVTADPQQIDEGASSQLNATGLDNYEWTPAESTVGGEHRESSSNTTVDDDSLHRNGYGWNQDVQVLLRFRLPCVEKLS